MRIIPYDTENQSRNASCVPFRGRGPRSGEGVDGGKNDYDTLILCLIALKGKRLTTFCALLALLHPLLSLTHWIFRSLMLPYKSSSLVQNVFAVHRFDRGRPPIGGQDRDGASYQCSAPYTLSRFAGLPLKGKREIWREKQGVIYFMYHSGVSPFGGWRHHLARWEACHWIRGSRGSPMNPVPLPPPQFGGAAKGKRLNGQARRLTSPHLEVLCRTSTGAL